MQKQYADKIQGCENMSAKDTQTTIRLSAELLKAYQQYCENEGTTVSDDLRRYMTKCVKGTNKN